MSAPASPRAPGAIGCAARPLPGREARGVIERVFARSAHLRAGGVFLTLGGPSLPRHPFSILTPQFPSGLTAGGGFVLSERALRLECGPSLDLSGLRRYAPAQKIARPAGPAAIARTLEAARGAALGQSGLFRLVPGEGVPEPAAGPEALLRERAGLLAGRLFRAARASDWAEFESAARDLAGLGLGLTPSGDDFLAGMLAALRFCGRSGGRPVPREALERTAATAASRTSAFSGFLLRGAAAGLVAEPVCRWLCAVCAGKIRLATLATRQVLTLGSTSGADTLAGLIAGVGAGAGLTEPAWT